MEHLECQERSREPLQGPEQEGERSSEEAQEGLAGEITKGRLPPARTSLRLSPERLQEGRKGSG